MAGAAAAAAAAAAVALALAAEDVAMHSILEFCEFDVVAEQNSIMADGFGSYKEMLSLTEKDIEALAKEFSARTVLNGKIHFRMKRTNNLKAAIHWAQDFRRIGRETILDPAIDEATFLTQIQTAKERATIRENMEESDGLTKASDPGKLKKLKDWTAWSRGLQNYLSTILGQQGVPLSCVIREETDPDYDLEQEVDYDFEQLCVNCAPLTGQVFRADARKVHQLIHGFVQGESSETWTKPSKSMKNGRIDYQALLAHYGGEGSKSVRIQEAEALRATLSYKNERAMTFEKFLTQMQAMFAGFESMGEVMTDAQKIRLLFAKVNCPTLTHVKNALQVNVNLDEDDKVTYDFIANSFSAAAGGSAEPSNRQASGVEVKGSAPTSGVRNQDGSIFIGCYPNWNDILKPDRALVHEERKKLGVSQGKDKARRKTSEVKTKKTAVNTLKRQVSALKVQFKSLAKSKKEASSDEDADEDDGVQTDAGNKFGGRSSKKQAKKKKGDKK